MSNGVNKVILIGNLGADPEVRRTQNGNAVANLRLACNERKKDGDQWVEHTEWVSVVTFGRTAENCGEYLKKGRQVYVEGRLQTRKWTDRDGNDRYSTEVVAQRVNFLSSPKGGESGKSSGGDDGFFDGDLPY